MRTSMPGAVCAAVLLAVLLAPCAAKAKAKAKPPPAEKPKPAAKPRPPGLTIEAKFKERIQGKIRASLVAAHGHLAWVLGVAPGAAAGTNEPPGPFGHYEMELSGDRHGHWRSDCESDLNFTRDSTMLCAMHKLEALALFCETRSMVKDEHRDGVAALLSGLLAEPDTTPVPGLGARPSAVPGTENTFMVMFKESPESDRHNISLSLHTTAMLATLECGRKVGYTNIQKDAGATVARWFEALMFIYKKHMWDGQRYYENSMLWEALLRVVTIYAPKSQIRENMDDYLQDFGSTVQVLFADEEDALTSHGMQAIALRLDAERSKARKKRLGQTADLHIKRWLNFNQSGMNLSEAYTCHYVKGMLALLNIHKHKQSARLIRKSLQLLEKDIDLFQVGFVEPKKSSKKSKKSSKKSSTTSLAPVPSKAAEIIGVEVMQMHGKFLKGGFVSDEHSYEKQGRRSLRVDDTSRCVAAMAQAFALLDNLEPPESGDADVREVMETNSLFPKKGRSEL